MKVLQPKLAKQQCRRVFTEILHTNNENCLQIAEADCVLRCYKRKEIVFQAGTIPMELPFIVSGSVCGYFVNSDGKQTTDCIASEFGDPLTNASTLEGFGARLDICYEALEPLTTVSIPMKNVLPILTTYPEVMESMHQIVGKWLERHRQMARWRDYDFPNRYDAFSKEYPGLPERLMQVSVALCLNADPATVSKHLKKIRLEKVENLA